MRTKVVNALVTPQWRAQWDAIDQAAIGAVPGAFFTFVLRASELRGYSGVYRRNPAVGEQRNSTDSVQRPHEAARSREIRRYVETGYPMSTMTTLQLLGADDALQRPGWLPTAVVVNILSPGQSREGLAELDATDAVAVPDTSKSMGGDVVALGFPDDYDASARAHSTAPLEVIDGQHRLWAFEGQDETTDFYLPVVAFHNLSKPHQAYIFWTINIKPKKINTSLAFDLYPLLRSQEWLMRGEGLRIYREARAQELTEAMWATPASPWYDRINMIGATGGALQQPVSQASFVRSLQASFIKPWDTHRGMAGGLFGNSDAGGLDWDRSQQAAFLIASWQATVGAISTSEHSWWEGLQTAQGVDSVSDPLGRFSMLASDQGVRAFHLVLNDVAYQLSSTLGLSEWRTGTEGDDPDPLIVAALVREISGGGIGDFLRAFGKAIALFDWRTGRTPGLSREEARHKAAYRGSAGYVALRYDIYGAMARSQDEAIAILAAEMLSALPTGVTDE